jgi:hypothetical protein
VRRRRRVPYLLLGVVLVVGCAFGGVLVARRVDHRGSVLVLARPVHAGQALSGRDVREAAVSLDESLRAVAAGSLPKVIGRKVAYSLPPGVLLTPAELGPVRALAPGQGVAAVALKAGQYPPGLEPGDRVSVVVAPSSTVADQPPVSADASGVSWEATVTGIQAAQDAETTVVSVQLAEDAARQLAAAPAGQVSVVLVNGGEG